jgi:flagellar basal-body rod protein FlgB
MSIFPALLSCLRHCNQQAKFLSSNIANLNTPGFKARKLTDFVALEQSSFDLKATSPMHLHNSMRSGFVTETMQGQEKPNGNNVDILEQMNLALFNQTRYETGFMLFKSLFDLANSAQGK